MKKGFTLIELMVVIVIIGILAALAIPRFLGATNKAKLSEWKSVTKQIVTLQEAYKQYHDEYAGTRGSYTVLAKRDGLSPQTLTGDVDETVTKAIGFSDPGPQARFAYGTKSEGEELGVAELGVNLDADLTAGTMGYMDSTGTPKGDLTKF